MSLPDHDSKSRRIREAIRTVPRGMIPSNYTFSHSRGYLPHAHRPNVAQLITYRLSDSLPVDVVARLIDERNASPESDEVSESHYRRQLDDHLDAGHGSSVLRDPHLAAEQVRIWGEDAGVAYDLLAYVVMPNHVHVLIVVRERLIGEIVRRWKLRLNTVVRNSPALTPVSPTPLWQREYHDRYIRDEVHLAAAMRYIHHNPVKSGLCASPEDWPWSSASKG